MSNIKKEHWKHCILLGKSLHDMWHRNLKDLQLKFQDPLCRCQIIKKRLQHQKLTTPINQRSKACGCFLLISEIFAGKCCESPRGWKLPARKLEAVKSDLRKPEKRKTELPQLQLLLSIGDMRSKWSENCYKRWEQCLWHRFANMLRMLTSAVSALFWNLSKILCTLDIIGQRTAYSHISDVTLRLGALFLLLWVKAATMTAMISHTQPQVFIHPEME